MADVLHYPNAPITEAIIDLRVQPREGLTIEALRQVGEGEREKYPTDGPIVEAVGTMEVKPGVSASASAQQRPLGFKFVSEDEKCVWQSRGNGFTFSRLAPYESWEPFSAEARRLWNVYRGAVNPKKVVRLAVRYVNRLDVPGSSVDLDEYFQTAPRISDGLPDNLSGFFMQLRITNPGSTGCRTNGHQPNDCATSSRGCRINCVRHRYL